MTRAREYKFCGLLLKKEKDYMSRDILFFNRHGNSESIVSSSKLRYAICQDFNN